MFVPETEFLRPIELFSSAEMSEALVAVQTALFLLTEVLGLRSPVCSWPLWLQQYTGEEGGGNAGIITTLPLPFPG